MEESNILIIILIIILIFFLSADKNITTDSLNNNTVPLLLVLLILYFCFNDLSLGVLLLCIVFLILSTTNIKKIVLERLFHYTNDDVLVDNVEHFLSFLSDDKKDNSEKKVRFKDEDDIIDEETEENKVSELVKNDEYEKISYDDFKEEIKNFEGKSINRTDNINSIDNQKQTYNINSIDNQKQTDNINSIDNIDSTDNQHQTDLDLMFTQLDNELESIKK